MAGWGGGFQCRGSLRSASRDGSAVEGEGRQGMEILALGSSGRVLLSKGLACQRCVPLSCKSEVKSPASRASVKPPPQYTRTIHQCRPFSPVCRQRNKTSQVPMEHLAEGGTRIRGKLPVTHKLSREPSRLFPAPALQPQQSSSLGRLVPTVHFRRRLSVISVFARLRCRG